MNRFAKHEKWLTEALATLGNSLCKEDADALMVERRAMGESEWNSWFRRNRVGLSRYAQATSYQRTLLKDWREPSCRRKMILGAMTLLYRRRRLLRQLDLFQFAETPEPKRMSDILGWVLDDSESYSPPWCFDPDGNYRDNERAEDI